MQSNQPHTHFKKEYFKNYYQLNKEKIYKKYYNDHKVEVIERAKEFQKKLTEGLKDPKSKSAKYVLSNFHLMFLDYHCIFFV